MFDSGSCRSYFNFLMIYTLLCPGTLGMTLLLSQLSLFKCPLVIEIDTCLYNFLKCTFFTLFPISPLLNVTSIPSTLFLGLHLES